MSMSHGDPLGGANKQAQEAFGTPESPAREAGQPSAKPAPGAAAQFSPPVAPPPEAPAPGGYVLADYVPRLVAWVLDFVVIFVATFVSIFFWALLAAAAGDGSAVGTVFIVLLVIDVLVLSFGYAPFLMSKWNGQTIGKRAMNIRVVRKDGQAIGFGWGFVREVLVKGLLIGLISAITFYIGFLLNYLWPLWDEEHRALHDIIVGSLVVKA